MEEVIQGIKIDYEKLSKGLWELIKEHPDSACMSLGMFPASIMESLDKMLKEKIPDNFIFSGDPLHAHNGKEIRHEITHTICCNILGYAKEEGILLI